jgi:hypothetical protein
MGVSQPTIAGIESQDNDPRLSTLRRYALAVGAQVQHAVTTRDGLIISSTWAGGSTARIAHWKPTSPAVGPAAAGTEGDTEAARHARPTRSSYASGSLMSAVLDSFEAVARAMTASEDVLFGVDLQAETVGNQKANGSQVTCSLTGYYFVKPEITSFRLAIEVTSDALTSASIDVATNYAIPSDAVFAKEPFFEFANSVAAPHLRSYAQQILDGLLTQMRLPSQLLPPISLYGEGVFRPGSAPDRISADHYGQTP